VNRDAFSVEDVRWQGRGVSMQCTLWTPREYADRHGKTWATPSALASRAHGFQSAYATDLPERHFLEIHSRHSDGPWFLGIVTRGPLRPGGRKSGGALGYHSGMGGPNRTMANWFGLQTELHGRVFEPEALYRGVLYGTALAILALTSEARQGELVQVSADRFEPVRPYIVKDEHGQPIIDPLSGRPRYSVIILQRLLAKGRRHDSERNFYNVSAAVPLLQEISAGLQARHDGKIPVVPPRSSHYKSDDLRPERYLLQWNGLVLDGPTVNKLIRLVVDGVEFRDVHGRPFPVTTHILRHVGATAGRHEYGLPLETMAGILGHKLERSGHAPPATSYYTRLPLQDQLVEQQHAIDRMLDKAVVAREGIGPLDAAEEASALALRCDEQAREVLDRWHTYHPVVFGHCGRAGLCIRGTTRVLCLGCPFLNPRPEFKDRVETYRRAYEDMAERLERSGNLGEAREHRRLARLCTKLAHEMDLLTQAESADHRPPEDRALPISCDPSRNANVVSIEVDP
jgi:hypothetical protein